MPQSGAVLGVAVELLDVGAVQIPDQILGAMNDAATDESQWLDRYGNTIERIDIQL